MFFRPRKDLGKAVGGFVQKPGVAEFLFFLNKNLRQENMALSPTYFKARL